MQAVTARRKKNCQFDEALLHRKGEGAMATDGSASEQALRDRISASGFAVALSRGGQRATLATLGALLAIIDRRLDPKVIQIDSVSGGSITNAFVDQRCRLEELGPGELDDIATKLASTIIGKRVLARSWIVALLLAPIVFGIVAGIILYSLLIPWTGHAASIGIVVGLTVLIISGLSVEWLLDRTFVWTGERPQHLDPANFVVDLRTIKDIADDYRKGTWKPELIRKSDPSVKKREQVARARIKIASEHAATSPDTDPLTYVLGPQFESEGSFSVCGLANVDDWNTLQRSPAWKQLVEKESTGQVDAPTTLSRIESGLVRRLIVSGYLNTYLVSLFLKPLADGELDRLATLSDRLDKIVGG